MFVYESVPGTTVSNFTETDEGITCRLEGYKASQVTVQLEENTAYKIYEDGEVTGEITTNISGKLGMNFIRILPGDKVTLELSPYDLTKGRIIWRDK